MSVFENLLLAFESVSRVERSPGSDDVTLAMFQAKLHENIQGISDEIEAATYRPLPVKSIILEDDDKARHVHVFTIRDRVVQVYLKHQLNQKVGHLVSECAYGFAKGKGVKVALDKVDQVIPTCSHFYKADIEDFFDKVDHTKLLEELKKMGLDQQVLALLSKCLKYDYMKEGRITQKSLGLAQGSHLSPLLSNLYLSQLDDKMRDHYHYIRYVDDLLVLVNHTSDLESAKTDLQNELQSLGLKLNALKTHQGKTSDTFEFLGFIYDNKVRTIPLKAHQHLQDKLLAIEDNLTLTRGDKDQKKEQTLRGWEQFYKIDSQPGGTHVLNRFIDSLVDFTCPHMYMFDLQGYRYDFETIQASVSHDEINNHLAGKALIALNLAVDHRHKALAFDLDLSKGVLENEVYTSQMPELVEKLKVQVTNMCDYLKANMCYPLVEYSGRRGYHIWLKFDRALKVDATKEFIASVLQAFRSAEIQIDTYPSIMHKQAYVKLPLGIHPLSRQKSYFVDEFFEETDAGQAVDLWPVSNPSKILKSFMQEVNAEAFSLVDFEEKYGRDACALVKNCAMIRHLVEKAYAINYLDHSERLSLALLFKHLTQGQDLIHGIMEKCINYKFHVTQKYYDETLDKPIGCKKLKERHMNSQMSFDCACELEFRHFSYDTPINLLSLKKIDTSAEDTKLASSKYEEFLSLRAKRYHLEKELIKLEGDLLVLVEKYDQRGLSIDKGMIRKVEVDNQIKLVLEPYQ